MRTFFLFSALIGCALAGTASALPTQTFATFADPSGNAASPLFSMTSDLSYIEGSWTETGLTLQVPFTGETFTDVTFQMPGVSVDAFGHSAAGYIEFFDNASAPLMRIDFGVGTLSEFAFGARDTLANPGNVTITYPYGSQPVLSSESFAFSFTNFLDDVGDISVTAAFTSSAIPEPASLALLALGCLALLRRR